ncbi:hypothetical protein DFH08DRAFT_816068 [Mycena albidolilacea]|uniref:Uncharacterized protein n=1 Tax=Mycena albidolilacea TaxID=1033008 RepID=A0AAD6ZM27_9AGAR|nr:hypothetical protein DFH08DRAFT_816068 [Mycena albidolilacea]
MDDINSGCRQGHPIHATFVGDYPDQCLVTCTKTGDCLTCEAPRDNLGDGSIFPLRNLDEIFGALETLDQGPTVYAHQANFEPFWEGFPYTNIFRSITPDNLNQQCQGVVKHLISWLKEACDEAEINAHCRRLPPNHNIRLFILFAVLVTLSVFHHSGSTSFIPHQHWFRGISIQVQGNVENDVEEEVRNLVVLFAGNAVDIVIIGASLSLFHVEDASSTILMVISAINFGSWLSHSLINLHSSEINSRVSHRENDDRNKRWLNIETMRQNPYLELLLDGTFSVLKAPVGWDSAAVLRN